VLFGRTHKRDQPSNGTERRLIVEFVSDTPVEDAHTWQRPEHLAVLIGISDRTLRQWAKDGKAEKTRVPGGSVYYRMPETLAAVGTPEAGVPEVGNVLALVETMTAGSEERLETMRERITTEAVAAMEARCLADVAIRDLERAQATQLVAQEELVELRAQLARERAHAQALEAVESLPWWAWTKRRQLQTALVAGLLEEF
jgi:hypothetical protein